MAGKQRMQVFAYAHDWDDMLPVAFWDCGGDPWNRVTTSAVSEFQTFCCYRLA
jgi:hypothetical protein